MSNGISDDDKKLFRDNMRSVTPLKHKKIHPREQITMSVHPRKQEVLEPSMTTRYLSNYYTEEVGAETMVSYNVPGIPKKRLGELKRGEIRWQARLDLHGLTIPQAQDKLCQFVINKYHLKNRCVLIIHGKGGAAGEAPILKNHTVHWLKQLPEVLAFHSALPRDGGNGALYLLLALRQD